MECGGEIIAPRDSGDHLKMQIRIPRTAQRRSERTFARLIICPSASQSPRMFDGPIFKTGSWIEESQLWPTPQCPVYPLLLEFAGVTGLQANGQPSRGHNRSQDIHVLWRYDRASRQFCEIRRVLSEGPEWYAEIAPIVARCIIRPQIDHVAEARAVTGRLAALMDGELAQLSDEGRELALSFFYDQLVARIAEGISEQSQALRDSLLGGSRHASIHYVEPSMRKPPERATDLTPGLGGQVYTVYPDGSIQHLISVYDRTHPKSTALVRTAGGQPERTAAPAEDRLSSGSAPRMAAVRLQRKPPKRAAELKPGRAGRQTA
jgi:hypothetical protein